MEEIKIEHLSRLYGSILAVDDLNLTVEKGELLALLGLNGAGKSTTVRMLCTLTSPDAGDAYLNGASILRERDAVKRIIGMSPQESATAPNLTVYENLFLIARLHGLSKEAASRRISELEKIFSLDTVRNQKSRTLSGGWQRRLSIAMALVSEPRILFLDEPTLGLDVISRRELWSYIQSLKGKMTIVLTTHYLEEAEALADRVAIMAKGKLLACGTVETLLKKYSAASLEDAFLAVCKGEGESV